MSETIGDFSAYLTKGGVRFQMKIDGKTRMVPRARLPEPVAQLLEQRVLGKERGVVEPPKFPMPTEEEKEQLLRESLEVPEHLQMTAEEIQARQSIPDAVPLEPEDFDDGISSEEVQATIDGTKGTDVSADFLESVSIHTASLQDIAQAMYERFGIYTVYLGQLPQGDEFNPLTGEPFTKYHLGIAYQAAVRAANQGILNYDPEEGRREIDRNRGVNVQDQLEPIATTMGEGRRTNSFAYRTSVKGMNEQADGTSLNGAKSRQPRGDEDEPILEPPLMGKPIIRPDW